MPSVGNGMRSPKSLRNHSSPIHDATVKNVTGLARKFNCDMPRNGIDEEESAFAPRCRRNEKRRDRSALQETKEVTLGLLGSETLRYVPIDEDLLAGVKTRMHSQKSAPLPSIDLAFDVTLSKDLMVCEFSEGEAQDRLRLVYIPCPIRKVWTQEMAQEARHERTRLQPDSRK
jgi:hypothetical protein